MKTQIQSYLLLSVAILLVNAQTSSKLSYENILSDLFASGDVEGRTFHPLIEELQVETLDSEAKSLSFVARESVCSVAQKQQGMPCPLKQNGEVLSCNLVLSHADQENGNIDTSKLSCQSMGKEDALKQKIRMRRSKSGKGSGGSKGSGSKGSKGSKGSGSKGSGSKGGSRPGGGSSIAGGGSKGKGGTQTA
uniref:Cathelicidin n=1 Tax=Plecoglossus altivelis TaxID=61084 RepID=G0LD30_PLEAT|nr:cathelicidin [Plecoglossus altivelis]